MTKLPEPAEETWRNNERFFIYTKEQMLQFRRDALEEAAKLAEPRNKRPCDCECCDCGNKDDAQRVAEWDAENSVAVAIRKLKDET